ncbi:BrnT family toxin [Hansschlegelia plantiphila]|uniref:BrnT family toxin n=1 Tax=Hansschlegelia plantiphila TaxID=374655 RepID=A0A9W6J2J8_9HYPH|nr:BrnT family toxin [Hansschlegelia plantiphila]GLK69661.1 hypothetical protein GCM10008179_32990 [Hansschlegelia plantiphila]
MLIVWDEPKRQANLEKHALDFADLTLAFFESAIFEPGHSERWRALGLKDGAPIAVVFRSLGIEALSIISMRRASAQERRLLNG